jgi:putative cardiolipin synthase
MLITIALLLLVALAAGVLLADRLMPKGIGTPSHALPVEADATEWDRSLAPLLAAHPGETGVLLVNEGLDAFAARALSARSAGRSLDLQYYIWHDDLTGRLLALEAWRAAQRGVRVRMLLDDMNARGLDHHMLALDAHPNIEIRLYNPFRNRGGLRRLAETVIRVFRVNHRMHNKAWIVDGRMAVVGGRNIGKEYFDAAGDANFRDLDVILMGPAVAGASAVFDRYWNSDTVVPLGKLSGVDDASLGALVRDVQARTASEEAQTYLRRVDASSGVQAFVAGKVQVHWVRDIAVVSDPPRKWRDNGQQEWLVHSLAATIASASRRASLISPYFVPGETGTRNLATLSSRGLQVGIITNSLAANDVPAVHSGYARYRERLLAAGVRLHELRAQGRSQPATAGLFGSSGASLHTKAFVVDERRGFVGSFNMDPRSVNLNTEMGVLFDHPGLGAALQAEYDRLAGSGFSYAVFADGRGHLRWRDDATQPPTIHTGEPDASLWRRATASALRLLPIESQL